MQDGTEFTSILPQFLQPPLLYPHPELGLDQYQLHFQIKGDIKFVQLWTIPMSLIALWGLNTAPRAIHYVSNHQPCCGDDCHPDLPQNHL